MVAPLSVGGAAACVPAKTLVVPTGFYARCGERCRWSLQERIMLSVLVLAAFLSYLGRSVVRSDETALSALSGTVCARLSSAHGNSVYEVSDGSEVVRSVVGPSGVLLGCAVTANRTQAQGFVRQCGASAGEAHGGAQRQPELETQFARMSEAKSVCREFEERHLAADGDEESDLQDKVLKRSKRGFTYPGTLWCGAGNMADNYDHLGTFAETDSCCRTHDHCPHVIHAFSTKYGHTNFKWHSICHCDCDDALRSCLRKVNDTSSRILGQAFFNVIGVPCFELIHEEQCSERHWYGLCKQYNKFPIAVLKKAVPYDYGGIDVIDELTVAPPKKEVPQDEKKTESATHATVSSTKEPSLTNVVTAAEDFIKVLATVSTSQSSSSADTDRGESPSSEKKRKKGNGKNKKAKKQKGKGRKRKQKAETGPNAEEGTVVSPSGSKSTEVVGLSNFISESHQHDYSSRNTNGAADNEYQPRGKEEQSNEVMKDEPAVDKDTGSMTSSVVVQGRPAGKDTVALTEEITPSASKNKTATLPKEKPRGPRWGRRKKNKMVAVPPSEEHVTNTTDVLGSTSAPVVITITTVAQQQSFGSGTEKGPVIHSVTRHPKVKRTRSKERGDTEGRKKRRKVSSAAPTVVSGHEHSSLDNLEVVPHSSAPTVSTREPQVSQRLNVYTSVTALTSNSAAVKSTTTAAVSRSTGEIAPTAAPTKHHRHTIRKHRKPKKKAVATDFADVPSVPEHTPVMFPTTQSKVNTSEELSPRLEKPLLTPIEATGPEHSFVDDQKVVTLTAPPTVITTEPQVSHRLDIYGRRTPAHVTPLDSSINHLTEKLQPHDGWRLVATAAPVVKGERHRQRLRKHRKSKKKSPLVSEVSLPEQTDLSPALSTQSKATTLTTTVATGFENSSVQIHETVRLGGSPTVPPTRPQVSHQVDIFGLKKFSRVSARNRSHGTLKRLRSKERGLRRRTTGLSVSRAKPHFNNSSETAVPTVTGSPAAISQHRSGWRFFTTAAPGFSIKQQRPPVRRQRKSQRKAVATVVHRYSAPLTFTTAPSKVTTAERSKWLSLTTLASPAMSPIQFTMERVKAQFIRKKRRKAALLAAQT